MGRIESQAVVFDQGNTLIMDPFQKVLELKREEFKERLEAYGIRIDSQTLIEEWTRANGEVDYPHVSHFFQEEPILQRVLRDLKVVPEVAVFLGLDLLKAYRAGFKEVIASDPRTEQVRAILAELKARGKRLGVFSNDRALSLANTLRCMGIESYFEYVQTSESIGLEKPDPGVFQHILERFQLPPKLVTYVGDDPARDVDAAKNQGLNAILYSVDRNLYSETWRDYRVAMRNPPDAIIEDFAELLEIIA